MIFHWSLSNNQSPQVSGTLLSILVDLNNVVVWMVSTCPFISKSSGPITKPLITVLSVHLEFVSPLLSCSIFFSVLWQGLGTYCSYRFPSVLLCGLPERQSPVFGRFSFLLTITRLVRLAEIR